MGNKWTAAQRAAIEQRGKTLLVSAAAGSGKTATLTQRLIEAICSPEIQADISRTLVVTFTRAAATELRQRIADALEKALAADPGNRRLAMQAVKVGSAPISTIHSFCLGVLRENFAVLGISPKLRVADSAEAELLRLNIMDDLLDECFSGECAAIGMTPEEFGAFSDTFTTLRNTEELSGVLLEIHEKLSNRPDPPGQLRAYAEACRRAQEHPWDNAFDRFLIEELRREIPPLARRTEELAEQTAGNDIFKPYRDAVFQDRDTARRMQEALLAQDWPVLEEAAVSYEALRLGAIRNAPAEAVEVKEGRTAVKDSLKEWKERLVLHRESRKNRIGERLAERDEQLARLFAEYETRLTEEKRRRGVCDFGDIEAWTLSLLVKDGKPTEIARTVAACYDVICIDEYQDVNGVQDAIFAAISTPTNRFMVGDIKQSIYSFRGSDPGYFAALRDACPPLEKAEGSDCAAIFMAENFRCDDSVIRYVNSVFAVAMPCGSPALHYDPARDALHAARPGRPEHPFPVQLAILESGEKKAEKTEDAGNTPAVSEARIAEGETDPAAEESADAVTREAEWVAGEISRLLQEGKNDDGTPIRPGDIAILMRSKAAFPAFREALEKRGVPVGGNSGSELLSSPVILLMTALLNVVNNPLRDIYLAAVLRSPLFGFSLEDIVRVRRAAPSGQPLYTALLAFHEQNPDFAPASSFLRRLADYREQARSSPVDKLLRYLEQETRIRAYARDPGAQSDLNLLYDAARRFEGGSFRGLYHFIDYINDISRSSEAPEGSGSAEGDNAVRMITIHHAKGLEFPVCFVSRCGSPFNEEDARGSLIFSREFGPVMKLWEESNSVRCDNSYRRIAAREVTRRAREEELRLLYVALTRAREKLYVTGTHAHLSAFLEAQERVRLSPTERDFRAMNAYLPILLSSASPDTYESRIFFAGEEAADAAPAGQETPGEEAASTAEGAETAAKEEGASAPEDPAEDARLFGEKIGRRLCFVYPRKALTTLPAKLSVSKLSPTVLDNTDDGEETLDFRELPALKHLSDFRASENEAALAGTATHTFLQFCDFDAAAQNPEEEARRLVREGFLPADYAARLSLPQLHRFFTGDFYRRMRAADRLWREFRFNLRLPCGYFTQDEATAQALAGEELLVQGVIDCFFEEAGKVIVVDYKTDRLTHAELADPALAAEKLISRHRIQLSYYGEACRRICGKEIGGLYLYSLPAGRAFAVPFAPEGEKPEEKKDENLSP